ncbi:unnamed protein product [Strongylus vulgaris]|uniref:Citrate transporter-like domain-containing protein n=1 Tax=Strongylus vulgaris TaxID=40348 RepID=A0A3P7JDN3_STRVU|nr:unnamed protein product [Strongylus vulgaris]
MAQYLPDPSLVEYFSKLFVLYLQKSGLSSMIACLMKDIFGKLDSVYLLLAVTSSITFMTEFASNVSTGSVFIPIVLTIAESLHIHPLYLSLPVTVACSFAFMLPMATPPNAIVYDTKLVGMLEMVSYMKRQHLWNDLVQI